MANLLNNPTLAGFSLGRYFTEENGQVGTMENPNGWEFVATSRETDPNKLPQSLHRDRGFVIAAGYRAWEGGYKQGGVQLQAGQRYLAKAVFKPDINFIGDVDLTAITWRFRIVSPLGTLEQEWQSTGKGQYKMDEENLFVFQSAQTQVIEYQFLARSVFAGNAADFNVYELALEPVMPDYGGAVVPLLGGTTPTTAPVNTNVSASAPAPTTPVAPAITTATGPSGKSLGSVLTAGEIDTIVLGLRSLATQTNPQAALGLNTLANALEKLK